MKKSAGKFLMLLGLFFLASCSTQGPTTALSTPDLNPVRTEVAATIYAQVPALCALTPQATLPATATTAPTATVAPSQTPAADANTQATQPAQTSLTPGVNTTNDKAKWITQTVADGTRFAPNQSFRMTWTIQNVGKTTWTADYRLRFFAGNGGSFGAPKEIALDHEVKPGESIDITVEMKAPAKTGEFRSDWVMSNAQRGNFKEPVYLIIKVGAPTNTPTLGATYTPTTTITPAK